LVGLFFIGLLFIDGAPNVQNKKIYYFSQCFLLGIWLGGSKRLLMKFQKSK